MIPYVHPLSHLFDEAFEKKSLQCVSCGRCKTLCVAFPRFYRLRAEEDAGIPHTEADYQAALDLCCLCGQCELRCPANLELAQQMARAKFRRVAREGLPLGDRFLTRTDWIGRWGSRLAPLSNLLVRSGPVRWLAERGLGVDRRRVLPPFRRETLDRWTAARVPARWNGPPNGRVAYFPGCTTRYHYPSIGKAAVEVLEKNRVDVAVVGEACCGLPSLSAGDEATAREAAQAQVDVLLPWVEKGYALVFTDCNCAHQMKHNVPAFWPSEEARRVAEAVTDLATYLWTLLRTRRLQQDFRPIRERVGYHYACHARSLRFGNNTVDVLRAVPGLSVEYLDLCCGMGGAFGMKKRFYETSLEMGEGLFQEIRRRNPDRIVTDAPLCGLQITQQTGIPTLHPVELLWEAYRPAPQGRPAARGNDPPGPQG